MNQKRTNYKKAVVFGITGKFGGKNEKEMELAGSICDDIVYVYRIIEDK